MANKYVYTYSVWEKEEDPDWRTKFKHFEIDNDADWLIPQLAKDYFENHDGWDIGKTWERDGVLLHVWKPDGTYWGNFLVKTEYEPRFVLVDQND